jgi:uncharacterized membrane protein YphA (DoxX/SURF4 family)
MLSCSLKPFPAATALCCAKSTAEATEVARLMEIIGRKVPSARSFPILTLVRFSLGAVFVYASLGKILNPQAFAEMVYNYQILPDGLINLTAIILPWLELLLGLCLITHFLLPGAIFLANLLLLTFFGALVFNVTRGLDIHCGCFSTSPTDSPGSMMWYLLRDSVFVLSGLYLGWSVFLSKRQTGAVQSQHRTPILR